jgi:hypothetical protein
LEHSLPGCLLPGCDQPLPPLPTVSVQQPTILRGPSSLDPAVPGAEYGFLPEFEGALKLPGVSPSYGGDVPSPLPQASLQLNSRCFSSAIATIAATGTDPSTSSTVYTATVVTSGSSNSTACDELYLFGAANTFQVLTVDKPGQHNVTFVNVDSPAGAAEWAAREGLRVFRFYGGLLDTVGQVLATVDLFVPSLTTGPNLDAKSMALNRQFIQQYANLVTVDRPVEYMFTGIDPDDIPNGSLLAIHRADGLGTLEEFGTGEATTHIAVAVRLGDDNQLFVVESTDTTSYWPNPNIQKTLWTVWTEMAMACNYTVAVLPLRPEFQAVWNSSAVEDWLAYTLGFPYGYHNFLNTVSLSEAALCSCHACVAVLRCAWRQPSQAR